MHLEITLINQDTKETGTITMYSEEVSILKYAIENGRVRQLGNGQYGLTGIETSGDEYCFDITSCKNIFKTSRDIKAFVQTQLF
jgi:hypothetical protein